MAKIALIGAGSVVFTRNVVNDILSFPALADSTISLMDIDPSRLELARNLIVAMVAQRGVSARIEATLDRAEAIRGAQYVIVTVQVGGLEAYAHDIEIPARYGVGQCVGDTLGPGGVFRGLRTIPVLLDLCREMEALCPPGALLINYSNPMAINCWAVASTGRPHVGLCHSVQSTSRLLAHWIGAPYGEVTYRVAGINHQAWFLEFKQRGEDAYPRLKERTNDPAIRGEEPVRIALMDHFGAFVTESSGHASEYMPYLRKSVERIEVLASQFNSPDDDWFDWGRTGGYLRHCRRSLPTYLDTVRAQAAGEIELPTGRSDEYGAGIINAMETNEPLRFNGNVPNTGLITNLPYGSCVEVPCLADASGIQPTHVGLLPPQLAALNRTMINVQELATQGGVSGDREAVHHAVLLDPLTAAVCDMDQIHQMVDELLTAEAAWLPQFS
jgi:alpha-galactosidase